MGHSKLASYFAYSPNHYNGRKGYVVDTLTPHFMGGNCTVETCGTIFAPTSRRASSNYGIGSDGRIAVYVDEANAAWTSGSYKNDCRAITFECANLADGSLTNACWNSLVALCADICRRYGFKGVQFTGSADHSKQREGYMLLTMHRYFQDTDCPGNWFAARFGKLAEDINAAMGGAAPTPAEPKNNTQGGKLDVDGYGGYNTVLDLQHALGTYEDGVISRQWYGNRDYHWAIERTQVDYDYGEGGSTVVKALQLLVGADDDGQWGKDTSAKLQEHLIGKGYSCGECGADGIFGRDSVRALQRCLNDGKLR